LEEENKKEEVMAKRFITKTVKAALSKQKTLDQAKSRMSYNRHLKKIKREKAKGEESFKKYMESRPKKVVSNAEARRSRRRTIKSTGLGAGNVGYKARAARQQCKHAGIVKFRGKSQP
jgi:hypothetical protein